MTKLKKLNPVSLILTYENGKTIEFNITTLVSMESYRSGGILEQSKRLEITLEYDEELHNDTRRQITG